MAQEIIIPKLGLTMTDATLTNWLIGTGERVVKEQIICIIETDKISFEMPAPGTGLLHPIVESGRRVEVGELIGYIVADKNELKMLQARHTPIEIEPVEAVVVNEPAQDTPVPAPTKKLTRGGRIPVSPAARKLSQSLGIDLGEIFGSGPGGRIVLADVEKAEKTVRKERMDKKYDFGSVVRESENLNVAEEIDIRGIRKIIFKNMKTSLAAQAQLTLHTDASAEAMYNTRALLNARLKKEQLQVSYNAIIVKASAQALRDYPMLNAVVDGRKIKIWRQIHIGVAMDFGQGLIVPKIRNADTKSIRTISEELNDLAARAEKKKLLPDQLQEGTFTITNLGALDVDHFTPISNFPESAILGVGRIIEKPWVRDGQVVTIPRVALSLTFDHRIVDGALAARFLKAIKDRIEETRLML